MAFSLFSQIVDGLKEIFIGDETLPFLYTGQPVPPEILEEVRLRKEAKARAKQASSTSIQLSSDQSQTSSEKVILDFVDNPPPLIDGQLKVGQAFGMGGYSLVHSGELSRAGTVVEVAIKIYIVDNDDEREMISKRIAREARVSQGITHPNILPFYGICMDPGENLKYDICPELPALVTALCKGKSIDKYFKAHPKAPRLPLILEAAVGLEYLHALDIVHGDLKPDNILITYENGTGKAKAVLGDFGRSRVDNLPGFTTVAASSYLYTAPELAVDTIADIDSLDDVDALDEMTLSNDSVPDNSNDTMPPEEPAPVQAAKVTKESDVYALALTILTLVSGKKPFGSYFNFKPTALLTVYHKRPRRSDHKCPEMCDDLWKLLEQCWRVDPSARLSATEVVNGLRKILERSPTPPS